MENEKDLSNYRKVYQKSALDQKNVPQDPITLFQRWFYEVEQSGSVDEVNAMTLTTIGLDGFPKSRVVLLKRFNENGFVFFTNYNSEKGKAIAANPHVCVSFFWPAMERQVIIKGTAHKLAENLSDGYFESRPRGSQLGALVSNQSEPLESREYLEDKLKRLEAQYEGKEIPRPDYWGGFTVEPHSVEFWQGRPNRLHDRLLFKLGDDFNWEIIRLNP
ncbi:pyridoxamine 5'-phosphate oxidase [Galbibacter sp.]|uniref:pyridoxamine 5'-phosphate oxidase n=1 Tax=Galbibacter sp. TaxID=2918471 RepID=UPI003A92D08A